MTIKHFSLFKRRILAVIRTNQKSENTAVFCVKALRHVVDSLQSFFKDKATKSFAANSYINLPISEGSFLRKD